MHKKAPFAQIQIQLGHMKNKRRRVLDHSRRVLRAGQTALLVNKLKAAWVESVLARRWCVWSNLRSVKETATATVRTQGACCLLDGLHGPQFAQYTKCVSRAECARCASK